MRLAERLLLGLSRAPSTGDYPTTTSKYDLANALNFPRKTLPGFDALIRGQNVLDYGCGPGWQAVAMRRQCMARSVLGIDINDTWLKAGRALAEREGCSEEVKFANKVDLADIRSFDVAISISSFEHFAEPEKNLSEMCEFVRPGGRIIVTFAEPWYSHNGAHMVFFTKVPWVNVLFSEETVLNVRSHFRCDGATRYEEIEGGLNRMTLAKFERIMRNSGMKIEYFKYYSTKQLPLVDRLPVLREFLVSAATCMLRRPLESLR
jgi:ubiquinone/menaquinone biosynthesis C-methylase UbiE